MHFSLNLFICMVIFTGFFRAGRLQHALQFDPGTDNTSVVAPSVVTIDAALSYRENLSTEVLLLFSGHLVVGLKSRTESFKMERNELEVPDSLHLQAAFQREPDVRYYYGDKHGYYIKTGANIRVRKLKYGPMRKFIRDGGPDAVGMKAGKPNFFKGCKLAIRHSLYEWKIAQNDIRQMGLPCNVDAAWNEGMYELVVLKGDQFWRVGQNGKAEGPYAFDRIYTLNDWALKPVDEVR